MSKTGRKRVEAPPDRYILSDELGEIMGVSRSTAMRIIRKLNMELEAKGFLVIAGRIPRQYFEERYYGSIREGV